MEEKIDKLDFSLDETITETDIEKFLKEIEERLIKMEELIKRYTIDRFEEKFAVCEDRETGQMININRSELPEDVKEGSIIMLTEEGYRIDKDMQEETEDRIKQKMDDLWE